MIKALVKAWQRAVDELRLQRQVKRLSAEGLDMEALKSIAKSHEKFIKVTLPDRTVIEIWRDIESGPQIGEFW